MKKLGDIGEVAAIDGIRKALLSRSDVVVGIGDDCAVVRPAASPDTDWLLTSDPVIEGVHFDGGTPPELVGRKAIGRALSDIAAMGGAPDWALSNFVAPAGTELERCIAIYHSAAEFAGRYGMVLVGGDTARGPVVELHVFAVGHVPRGTALLRSGGRPSDGIYVTGALGGSILGRHLDFVPRVREGAWLRENGWATAMIDLSDGLATDLRHVCTQSGTGAELSAPQIPISEAAQSMRDGRTPLEHAMRDGEDFELLFTVPAQKTAQFEDAWRLAFSVACTRIGWMNDRRGRIEYVADDGARRELTEGGYEHFTATGLT